MAELLHYFLSSIDKNTEYFNARKEKFMKQQSSKPNILFVLPDEFRKDSIGCLNMDPVYTPNLDRFVSESMSFSNAVSTYPTFSMKPVMIADMWENGISPLLNPKTFLIWNHGVMTEKSGMPIPPFHSAITSVFGIPMGAMTSISLLITGITMLRLTR